ncbi:MAG: circadian clock protein KaiA [Thermosynechococcus sp. Uc]|uniref:circadian clock protein KaiA n=1 Tax=Thermosynechococcus sp. Uc TaxID=3034853 RepID=UPI0019EBB103|nr:circadian clock protein KaiA [Thermosynechococcus sp. Uc]MDM7326485.1 circadian clock protein KaiA [Thermosynechococcus sp. Uc]HIK26135.1 circadian clock protein KaiA [Thermosynechococcus sp. M46_R2017_013]
MAQSTALTICGLVYSPAIGQELVRLHKSDIDELVYFSNEREFCTYLEQRRNSIACLILEWGEDTPQIITYLHHSATLLPAILIFPAAPSPPPPGPHYHVAEVILTTEHLHQLNQQIEEAIAEFVKLCPGCAVPPHVMFRMPALKESSNVDPQHRLSQKLKERLGYLGVYYKRDTAFFFRRMSAADKRKLLDELRSIYRTIVLEYFNTDAKVNEHIDEFVSKAFFADISVAQVLEIHVELMDNFSKQLKLEGRSEDVLLDYRLTLIDVIAHLCEMYRRSIPREV